MAIQYAGELRLSLTPILEDYTWKNYKKSLDCDVKPTSLQCILDEQAKIEKDLADHAITNDQYLQKSTVCNQKTEVERKSMTFNEQENIGPIALQSNISQKEYTARENTEAKSKTKGTTFDLTFRPTVSAGYAGATGSAGPGSASVTHKREVSHTSGEAQSHATEQHLGASSHLAAQQAAKSTFELLTLVHSCTVKDISLSTEKLKSYTRKFSFTVEYMLPSSKKECQAFKKDKQLKHYFEGKDVMVFDGTYTWKSAVVKDTRE